MGCCFSQYESSGGQSREAQRINGGAAGYDRVVDFKPPRWKSTERLTEFGLEKKREEFWDTAPFYGGDRVIWDALKGACEADTETAKIIIQSAGIIVSKPDMTVCYDERGSKYELPKYVLSKPTNLAKDTPAEIEMHLSEVK